ncbi:MAG: DedA family protein [Gemmatimonadales bacterium]
MAALASWPPGLVYALILASCFVENAFPPSPSDVFVVMASFLSHRGSYDPLMVMLTALVGGVSGAVTVYAIARRSAASFGRTRLGRAVLPPEATAFLLKEYGRYGALGLFLTRLLPGFRSVVAPFAGLSGLGPFAALAPIVLACLTWYAALTLIGSRLGAEWDGIRGVLESLNDALLVVALTVAVLLAWWIVRRRRNKPR